MLPRQRGWQAHQGRTTNIVVRRLSSSITTNAITSFKNENVFELGTHDNLMKGVHNQLVTIERHIIMHYMHEKISTHMIYLKIIISSTYLKLSHTMRKK